MLVRVQSGMPKGKKMKTLDQVREIKKRFANEYRDAFRVVGNNLATGLGKDSVTGDYTIVAMLTNNKLKSTLPDEYEGVKVEIEVVGKIVAQ
jgi:NifB/MoaA-like Fe-S oxidoreductase